MFDSTRIKGVRYIVTSNLPEGHGDRCFSQQTLNLNTGVINRETDTDGFAVSSLILKPRLLRDGFLSGSERNPSET